MEIYGLLSNGVILLFSISSMAMYIRLREYSIFSLSPDLLKCLSFSILSWIRSIISLVTSLIYTSSSFGPPSLFPVVGAFLSLGPPGGGSLSILCKSTLPSFICVMSYDVSSSSSLILERGSRIIVGFGRFLVNR